jgi:hypothetical protein
MNAPPVLGLRRHRLPLPTAAEGVAGLRLTEGGLYEHAD